MALERSVAPVFWLTGLSGAGKTTLSRCLRDHVEERGRSVLVLDGDALRSGLCRDLGFSDVDRDENVRRAAEVARLVAQGGTVAICALISPLVSQRKLARSIVGEGFVEVFVDCSLAQLVERDPKGLYARALKGEIMGFTGVTAPYERPPSPDVHLRTGEESVERSFSTLLRGVGRFLP